MSAYDQLQDRLTIRIEQLARESFRRLVFMIEKGSTPQEALSQIYLSFSAGSFNAVYVSILKKAFSDVLNKPFTTGEILDLPVNGLKLSAKLYQNAKEVEKGVLKVFADNKALFGNLRKLSLEIYSGYGQKPQDVLKVKDVLPKYLKKTLDPLASELDKEIAKLTASGLKTDSLRAGYLQLLDKIESGAGKKALQKSLEVAAAEKSRYLATRIAKQEVARAYGKDQAKKIRERTDVQFIQIRPSNHHKPDLCDLYLHADRYGKGGGIYPKLEAPTPPFHIGCLCRQVVLVNLQTPDTPTLNKDAEARYLNELPEEVQKKILPQSARDYIDNGGSLTDYLNSKTPDEYRIRSIKEVV